jgi:uncharacterized protein with predicted RNA binding PUA domain
MMDSILKIKCTIDALFGTGVSNNLPKEIKITYSRRTGRKKCVHLGDALLCTLNTDGRLAITTYFAHILMKSKRFKENCLEIDGESRSFIEGGRSVFCKHVTWCGKNVWIGGDVPVLYQDEVIAVGRAVLSTRIIKSFKRGVAVKIRDSLKSTD